MNIHQLRLTLEASRVEPSAYSIGSPKGEEQYVIEEVRSGLWVTYYWERGERLGLKEFLKEDEACLWFLQTLRADSILSSQF